jgi:hypothetical protein
MDLHGFTWIYMDSMEIIWIYMDLHGINGNYMDLMEFIYHYPLVNIQKTSNNYGKSQFLMGKSTTSMAIFNSYVSLPEGKAKYIPSTNTVTCN